MKDLAADVVQELLILLKDTKSFVIEQAPEIAREIVLNGRILSLTMVLASITGFICAYKFHLFIQKEKWDEFSYIFVIFMLIGSVFFLCFGFSGALLALFSPKLYILNELRGGCH